MQKQLQRPSSTEGSKKVKSRGINLLLLKSNDSNIKRSLDLAKVTMDSAGLLAAPNRSAASIVQEYEALTPKQLDPDFSHSNIKDSFYNLKEVDTSCKDGRRKSISR